MARTQQPAGPKGSFLIGNTLQYVRDPLGFMTKARDCGDVVRMRLGNLNCYLFNRPEDIEFILRGHGLRLRKDKLTRLLAPVVGQGLLTSEGDFWRRQRKLAQPAFQLQQIQRYGEVMIDHTSRMLDTWNDGKPVDIHEELMRLTLGIVAKTLFDTDVSETARDVGDALDVVMTYYLEPTKWFRFREWIPTPSTVRFHRSIRRIDEIIYAIIRQRRQSDHNPGDLLSHLLAALDDEGSGMTDRQLRDEAVTIFLAGHETTALALSYCFYLLAQHPGAETRLAQELRDTLSDRSPTVADVPKLHYTEWVVRESMRLYPPAWAIGREMLEAGEIAGYHIPKGSQLFLCQWTAHRDDRWFEEAEAFRPERWADDLAKRLPARSLFSLRGRSENLHRQSFRNDGSCPDPGDHRPTLSSLIRFGANDA